MSSISALRSAIIAKKPLALLPAKSDITNAKELSIGSDDKLSLDDKSGFITQTDGTNQTIRAIYQCWLHHDSSTADYLTDCESKSIPVISFLERTDLLSYLSGSSDSCKYIEGKQDDQTKGQNNEKPQNKPSTEQEPQQVDTIAKADNAADHLTKRRKLIESDPTLKLVLENERDIVDHNKALRGSKLVDFSNVARECEYKIIRPGKRNAASAKASRDHQRHHHHVTSAFGSGKKLDSHSLAVVLKHKDPIIILSPSASALINMSNVKAFLEDGKFVDPTSGSIDPMSAPNMVRIVRNSKRFNRKIRYLVVNDVDKFFTKPEHWDRVVAVFTTGQEWQFKNYRYSNPNVLFQKVKGFYTYYSGDVVPPNVSQWNLEVIPIERSRRFKDRQISEYLWEVLEKFMVSKGYR